jgi:hypothetical protein
MAAKISAEKTDGRKNKPLNPRQQKFVKTLAKGASLTDAAIEAGYSSVNVAALGIRHSALRTAFELHGSYAPRDPKEAAQFGVKVIVLDMPRPPRHQQNAVIDVSGNGHKPEEEE